MRRLMRRGSCRLTIVRDQKRIAELSARLQIPESCEKNITRREGYLYEVRATRETPHASRLP